MSRLECLDEDGAGRSAEALFLFNDRNGRFSRKKGASSTISRIPISKRRDTDLAARVSMAARRDGDTAALSDSDWSSIVISRHCRYKLRHMYARKDPSP